MYIADLPIRLAIGHQSIVLDPIQIAKPTFARNRLDDVFTCALGRWLVVDHDRHLLAGQVLEIAVDVSVGRDIYSVNAEEVVPDVDVGPWRLRRGLRNRSRFKRSSW